MCSNAKISNEVVRTRTAITTGGDKLPVLFCENLVVERLRGSDFDC